MRVGRSLEVGEEEIEARPEPGRGHREVPEPIPVEIPDARAREGAEDGLVAAVATRAQHAADPAGDEIEATTPAPEPPRLVPHARYPHNPMCARSDGKGKALSPGEVSGDG